MTAQKLSGVIITFNEEKRIGAALDALVFCDEIVVVDSGSTDRTRDICTGRGCKVLLRAFDGYGPQKRYAVEQASNDWVFSVDADEIASDALREEIVTLMRDMPKTVDGFVVHRALVFMGRVMDIAGADMHLRLFNRRAGSFNSRTVHESVEVAGRTRELKGVLLHHSYEDLSDYLGKFNQFTTAAAREMHDAGKRGGRLQAWARFPLTFLAVYVLKGHCRFGLPGLVWSLLSALYPVVKYAKLAELSRFREKPVA